MRRRSIGDGGSDCDVLQVINGLVDAAYPKERGLDRETMELRFSKVEILEASIVTFQHGFNAWREVTGAEEIEPTVEAFEGGSG